MDSKKLRAAFIALSASATLAAAAPVFSADGKADDKTSAKKGSNVDAAKRGSSPQADAVVQAAMADQLIQYGDKNKDPLALITAARILNGLGVKDEKREKKTEGKGDDKAAKSAPRDQSPAGVLARAKEYAGGRSDLIALADEAAKGGTRGAGGGPIRHADTAPARTRMHYNVRFRGGEPAVLAISGDGDTDLDLYVYDENGNQICRADRAGDDEICRWTPRWTGTFRITVVNLGGVYNNFRMWSN